MDSIRRILDAGFRAIQAWFSGTDHARSLENLEMIIMENEFPNVVNFICEGKCRYFLVDEELVRSVANSVFQHMPITPQEGAFLDCIKSQLDGRVQLLLDTESKAIEEKFATFPRLIRSFKAGSPIGGDFRRFIIEVRVPVA